MTVYRKAIEDALKEPVKVVEITSEKEFIYLDKQNGKWKLTITKSLLQK